MQYYESYAAASQQLHNTFDNLNFNAHKYNRQLVKSASNTSQASSCHSDSSSSSKQLEANYYNRPSSAASTNSSTSSNSSPSSYTCESEATHTDAATTIVADYHQQQQQQQQQQQSHSLKQVSMCRSASTNSMPEFFNHMYATHITQPTDIDTTLPSTTAAAAQHVEAAKLPTMPLSVSHAAFYYQLYNMLRLGGSASMPLTGNQIKSEPPMDDSRPFSPSSSNESLLLNGDNESTDEHHHTTGSSASSLDNSPAWHKSDAMSPLDSASPSPSSRVSSASSSPVSSSSSSATSSTSSSLFKRKSQLSQFYLNESLNEERAKKSSDTPTLIVPATTATASLATATTATSRPKTNFRNIHDLIN